MLLVLVRKWTKSCDWGSNLLTTMLQSSTFTSQAIRFIQTVPIQPIQFSISLDFIYTQLNVKTVLF